MSRNINRYRWVVDIYDNEKCSLWILFDLVGSSCRVTRVEFYKIGI